MFCRRLGDLNVLFVFCLPQRLLLHVEPRAPRPLEKHDVLSSSRRVEVKKVQP